MESSQVYILISVIVLLIIATLLFIIKKNKKEKRLTILAGIAFIFILTGIFFGDNRVISYSLMGIGILLAIIDIITKSKKKGVIKEITKEKIGIGVSYLLQLLIFVYIIIGIYDRNYLPIIEGVIALFITFLPLVIKRKWGIHLPWGLNFLIVFSLYLHAEGRLLSFYYIFAPYYDKIGHFVGSATVALLGFSIVIIMNKFTKIRLNKIAVILFIIIFTMAMGGFWELLEFSSDALLHTNHQPSLLDTNLDLIFDLIGGIFIALITNANYDLMEKQIVIPRKMKK